MLWCRCSPPFKLLPSPIPRLPSLPVKLGMTPIRALARYFLWMIAGDATYRTAGMVNPLCFRLHKTFRLHCWTRDSFLSKILPMLCRFVLCRWFYYLFWTVWNSHFLSCNIASISRVSVLSSSGLCTFLISTWLGKTVLCNNWHVSRMLL